MGSIRKRNGKWQVQVRIQGIQATSRTFFHKKDAESWARSVETEIQRGTYAPGKIAPTKLTLADLLRRYRDNVTPLKRGRANETILLNALLRQPFAALLLSSITPAQFSEFRDLRLKVAKASTVNHELTRLSHVYRIAKLEWGIPVENPLQGIRRPKAGPSRTRRLQNGEWQKLRNAAAKCRNKLT